MKTSEILKKRNYLKPKDIIRLEKAIKEIKKLSGLNSIVQIGSSTYSKKYNDIDIIIFFNKVFSPPQLKKIRKRYEKYKFWIEGVYVDNYKITSGMKVFIRFFQNLKTKIILCGKDPYKNKKFILKKIDIAHYLWYEYHLRDIYGLSYENVLPNSLNAILTYKNIFPQTKEETLSLFKKFFPQFSKYLPKNAEHYLRKTNQSNFKNLYKFFEKSIEYFLK